MYKLHLILKYLRKRRIAWVSLVAVMLCTTMVLVVISVMGGWLEMFKSKFRGMSGDIVVYRQGLTGFAGYEEMIDRIKERSDVEAALPLIRTFGLANINNQIIEGVQVTGLDIEQFSKFNAFRESLWRQYQKPLEEGKQPTDTASFNLLPDVPYDLIRRGDRKATQRPGMIVGGPLVGMKKDKEGKVKEPPGLYDAWVRLEVVPLSSERRSLGDVTPAANIYWIVDASRTQLYQLDANSVYVPFHVLQADLQMGPREVTEKQDDGTEKVIRIPARASEIQIKLKPGADREKVIEAIKPIVAAVQQEHEPMSFNPVRVETWEKQQEIFLGAVENEKSLVTFLFGLISLVAVFLIFCILYMIVIEKTRDIGIIKSVGATSQGVAAIFLGYGLAIGLVGATFGFVLAWLIVRYINEIHTWLGKTMGLVIWKPEVYAFDKIPSTMDTTTIVVVMAVAVLSSVIGALVPAVRAASLNPVEALRFE